MKHFPSGKYGRQTLRFYPAPHKAPLRAFAVLVFPWQDEHVLLCDIIDRGWCIPSGRVEPFESSEEAIKRESLEEAGAVLSDLQYIGCYQICEKSEVRWADCYTAHVSELTEIQAATESRGRRFVPLSELPELYHHWNELTAQVFAHALQVTKRFDNRKAG